MSNRRLCSSGFLLEFHLKETCTSTFSVPGAEESVAVSCIWLKTVKVSVHNFTTVSRLTEITQA